MKRKIIQRNKQKYNERIAHRLYYLITRGNSTEVMRNSHKYLRNDSPERAYRRNERSNMIHVPITYSAKVKRSRIKDAYVGSRVFMSIEQFNVKYNLNLEISDIPVGRYEA